MSPWVYWGVAGVYKGSPNKGYGEARVRESVCTLRFVSMESGGSNGVCVCVCVCVCVLFLEFKCLQAS